MLSAVATTLIGYFAALAGAKRGARAAYELGRAQQKQDAEDKKFTALSTAYYTLIHCWNTLEVFKDKFFENYVEEDGRFHLPLIYIPDTPRQLLLNELRFIADFNPEMLRRIEIAEMRYLSVIDQFKTIRQIAERHRPGQMDLPMQMATRHLMESTADQIKRAMVLIDASTNEVGELRKTLFPTRVIVEAERVKKINLPTETAQPEQ